MIETLKILKKPMPFQPGNLTLWSNRYIAQNVLKKHLNGSIDSGTRKKITVNKTVQWINELKPDSKRILDVGCGPGIYGVLLCQNECLYEGIDISPYQIEYAKIYNNIPNKTDYAVCDFRKWDSCKRYDVCLLLYGIYSFYKREERITFLKNIKKHLNDNGIVIIEVFTEKHYLTRTDSTDWRYVEKNGFWCDKPYLELNSFYKYEQESLILIQAGVIRDSVQLWNSWISLFDKNSLIEELLIAGFNKFEIFGTCYGSPYKEDSDVLCVYAS